MSGMEIQRVADGLKTGACFGNWELSNAFCQKCVISQPYCEEATKRRGDVPVPELPVDTPQESIREMPTITPLEYLLESLRGRFEEKVRRSAKALAHFFAKDDGTSVIVVMVSHSGAIKIQSKKGKRVVKGLESVAQVESILKELL